MEILKAYSSGIWLGGAIILGGMILGWMLLGGIILSYTSFWAYTLATEKKGNGTTSRKEYYDEDFY